LGWQTDWSVVSTIVASQTPSQITSTSTSVVSDTFVRLSWIAPHDGNNALLSYDIMILTSDLITFAADLTDCSGSDPTSTHCDVPMLTLRALPFNLQQGNLIVFKVRANNGIGSSPYSQPNTAGALIEVEPH
jgi:hypothetical protein